MPYKARITILLFILSFNFVLNGSSQQRQPSSQGNQQRQAKLKQSYVLITGRSLNPAPNSKSAHQDSSMNRGHVSEVLNSSVVQANTVHKQQSAIASLEKHRKAKSSNKKSSEYVSVSKNQEKQKKESFQFKTIREGEKWVSICESAKQNQSIIIDDIDENQNKKQNVSDKKMRTRHTSKKKTEDKKQISQNKKDNKKQKSSQKTSVKAKSKGKSAAKSQKKSAAKSVRKRDSQLKRSKAKDNELTNQPEPEVEKIKSVKKSAQKSSQKKH